MYTVYIHLYVCITLYSLHFRVQVNTKKSPNKKHTNPTGFDPKSNPDPTGFDPRASIIIGHRIKVRLKGVAEDLHVKPEGEFLLW